MTVEGSAETAPGKQVNFWRGVRLGGASIAAAGLLVYSLLSDHVSALRSCSTQSSGEELCHGLAVNSAGFLAWLLGIVFLVLPDISEIAIPGLISLKRRVGDQERRQDAVERQIGVLVSQIASASAKANVEVIVADPRTFRDARLRIEEDIPSSADEGAEGEVEERQGERQDAVAEHRVAEEEGGVAGEGGDKDVQVWAAILAQDLIGSWERLAAASERVKYLESRQRADSLSATGGMVAFSEADLELLAWHAKYKRELELVRAARNTVAHAQPLGGDSLQEAVALAKRLEKGLLALGFSDSVIVEPQAVEHRVSQWLHEEGYDVQLAGVGSKGPDFRGVRQDGSQIAVEVKYRRSAVSPASLQEWAAGLMRMTNDDPDLRRALVVSAPELTPAAVARASTLPIEVYIVYFDGSKVSLKRVG